MLGLVQLAILSLSSPERYARNQVAHASSYVPRAPELDLRYIPVFHAMTP